MRIAVLMDLAPRKLGSFEGWLTGLAAEARRRGHALDVYGREPVHPEVARALGAAGAGWGTLDALLASRAAGVRRLSGYDVLHLDLLQPRSPGALLAYAAWPARVLFVACSDQRPDPSAPRWRRAASHAVDRITFARVDSLAAVSEHVRRLYAARFTLPDAKTRVVYNGVDLERFRPAAARPAHRFPLLVTIAHLVPHKGIDVLLRALARARLGGARLRVVGDGPLLPDLQVRARSLGLGGRVQFVGLRDDVERHLAEADAYVHPTLLEGFGNAIAEAMASGVPVIATRTGGIPEVVEHGRSGLLVPPGRARPLAAAMERVVRDGALRERLAAGGRERAVQRFGVDAMIAGHLDWCEERAGLRAPARPAVAAAGRGQEAVPRIAAASSRR